MSITYSKQPFTKQRTSLGHYMHHSSLGRYNDPWSIP
jgi:hypothetical protein